MGVQLMDPVKLVVAFFGLLMVVTRLPAVFNPEKFRGLLSKVVKQNVQLIGAFCLVIGGSSLYFILPQVPVLDLVASFFSLAMIVIGLVSLLFKDLPLHMVEAAAKQSTTFIRFAAFAGVVVGIALLYLALP